MGNKYKKSIVFIVVAIVFAITNDGCVNFDERFTGYLLQFQEWKYNRRNSQKNLFEEYLKNALTNPSCLLNYEPKKDTKEIAYGQ